MKTNRRTRFRSRRYGVRIKPYVARSHRSSLLAGSTAPDVVNPSSRGRTGTWDMPMMVVATTAPNTPPATVALGHAV